MAICILVCDRSAARLLLTDGTLRPSAIKEAATLVSPSARLRPRSFATERTGRTSARASPGGGPRMAARAGIETDADPRGIEAQRFAKRVARRLDVERRAGAIDSLVIVAAPRFLGELRKSLSAPTKALVRQEITADRIHLAPQDILLRVRREKP